MTAAELSPRPEIVIPLCSRTSVFSEAACSITLLSGVSTSLISNAISAFFASSLMVYSLESALKIGSSDSGETTTVTVASAVNPLLSSMV